MLARVNFMALSEKDNATSETRCCVISDAGVFLQGKACRYNPKCHILGI